MTVEFLSTLQNVTCILPYRSCSIYSEAEQASVVTVENLRALCWKTVVPCRVRGRLDHVYLK